MYQSKEAMNNEETILVPLNLSSSWQSIRPSYPKISIAITRLQRPEYEIQLAKAGGCLKAYVTAKKNHFTTLL